ncbi:MAG: mevalonate kinase [Chitinophagaceae bacterium]|nr:mevalonate kinase [Chitinophagaceae bacterium]MCW5913435.1 hypothetical protein [Chitinophagaceae bacterium]MCZ2395812.1 hypothetical protein [Chitinophagales bacterium]
MERLNSKVLLFGEYAVLNNGMALVIPLEKYHGQFEFYKSSDKNAVALQSNEYLRKFCAFVSSHMDEDFVLQVKLFEQELEQGLFFRSNIPQGYGLGSSGALVAAIVLRYLVKAKNLKDEVKLITYYKLKELKRILGNLESYFHGVSSGLDPLSIILNEPILYKNAQDIETVKIPNASKDKKNIIFLLDTEHTRTTSKMMSQFKELQGIPHFRESFDKYVSEGNNQAIRSFLDNDNETLYKSLYNISAFQLEHMKEFFPAHLQKEVAGGLDNGDYFLKLCGAGGGGFMLGFTQNWETTQEKLKDYKLEEVFSY